jgi:hypothetical protein
VLPTHQFLHNLLGYYQIELHHLCPGGILHIAVFFMLYEAFLGIQMHFSLWKYFLAHEGVKMLPVAGGVVLQIHNNSLAQYLWLHLVTSNMVWYQEWFVVCNSEPSLSAFTKDALFPGIPRVSVLTQRVGTVGVDPRTSNGVSARGPY